MAFWMVGKTVRFSLPGLACGAEGIDSDVDVLCMGEGGEESYDEEDRCAHGS